MTKRILLLLLSADSIATALAAELPRSKTPADVELYIISPKDGKAVKSPVTVRFGLRGMGIAPAGVAMENTGHHHLLIDAGSPAFDRPIPADRLQLLLADHLHIPHDPPVTSKPITITVRP